MKIANFLQVMAVEDILILFVCTTCINTRLAIVLISVGNSGIGAQLRIYFICFRHLIRSRIVTDRIYPPKRPYFLHACATFSELPSYISTMILASNPSEKWVVYVSLKPEILQEREPGSGGGMVDKVGIPPPPP